MEDVLLPKKSPNGHNLAHYAMSEVKSLRFKGVLDINHGVDMPSFRFFWGWGESL